MAMSRKRIRAAREELVRRGVLVDSGQKALNPKTGELGDLLEAKPGAEQGRAGSPGRSARPLQAISRFRVQRVSPAGQRRGRPYETVPAGFASGASYSVTVQAIDRRTALPDSWMSTFLEFFSDAADFALSGFPIWRV